MKHVFKSLSLTLVAASLLLTAEALVSEIAEGAEAPAA